MPTKNRTFRVTTAAGPDGIGEVVVNDHGDQTTYTVERIAETVVQITEIFLGTEHRVIHGPNRILGCSCSQWKAKTRKGYRGGMEPALECVHGDLLTALAKTDFFTRQYECV